MDFLRWKCNCIELHFYILISLSPLLYFQNVFKVIINEISFSGCSYNLRRYTRATKINNFLVRECHLPGSYERCNIHIAQPLTLYFSYNLESLSIISDKTTRIIYRQLLYSRSSQMQASLSFCYIAFSFIKILIVFA